MALNNNLERYRLNFRAEQEGSLLYQELAKAEHDLHLTKPSRPTAETE